METEKNDEALWFTVIIYVHHHLSGVVFTPCDLVCSPPHLVAPLDATVRGSMGRSAGSGPLPAEGAEG